MRPEIPDGLERRIEQIYAEAGYATGSELVRDAVRRWLPQVEPMADDEDISPRVEALLKFDGDYRPREKTPLWVDLRTSGNGATITPRGVREGSAHDNLYDADTRDEIEAGQRAILFVAPNTLQQVEYHVEPDVSWGIEETIGEWRIEKVHSIDILERVR